VASIKDIFLSSILESLLLLLSRAKWSEQCFLTDLLFRKGLEKYTYLLCWQNYPYNYVFDGSDWVLVQSIRLSSKIWKPYGGTFYGMGRQNMIKCHFLHAKAKYDIVPLTA